MAKLALVIDGKNRSSWSIRAWALLREAGMDFGEIALHFDEPCA